MAALATAFAPGKLILSGEHSVVHGHPALAVAVHRGCRITLQARSGRSGIDRPSLSDERIQEAMAQVLPPEGIGVEIQSDLPIGRGMGSSAAMSIALMMAIARLEGIEPTFSQLHKRGFLLERIFHGTPSGIDHAVSALGGILYYQRTARATEMRTIQAYLPKLVVLDSGTAGHTAEQIAKVRSLGRVGVRICEEIGEITTQIVSLLPDRAHAAIGSRMTENHVLLRRLGVSSPQLDSLVDLALEAGAYGAKLAGAGGGGVVIAAVENPTPVLNAAARAGYTAFTADIHPTRMEIS